jgi:hypothetical protein
VRAARVVLALLALALIGVLLFRSRGQRHDAGSVASYDEVKRRIRSGEASPDRVVEVPEPAPPMSLEKIYALDDSNEFVMALFGSIVHKMAQDEGRTLNASESAIVYVRQLEAEVSNGGFDQYFFNSSGDHAAEALAGLELIGARQTAAIARRAIAFFGEGGPSRDREARWKQMDEWSESQKASLNALDDEFYEYPDPIADLAMEYCLAHRDDFGD